MAGETQAVDDREAVLRAAAAARAARRRLLDELTAGGLSLDDVLERVAADPLAAKTKALKVVEAPGAARKVDIRRALAAVGIEEATPIGELGARLTAEQREALEPLFPGAAPSSL